MAHRFYRKLAALVFALACASPAAGGAEGMWTFDSFPAEHMRAQFGWAPDEAWLARVMQGVARLPNCSAAVVSGEGLVLTNEHCLTDCLERIASPAGADVGAGFAAHAREEEVRCPGLALQVLAGITDVTARIQAAAANADAASFSRARDAEIDRIIAECAGSCQVETLYQGGRYALYRYQRFDDVRLVFAPEHAMAAFGGDEDNFVFPRYAADFAFLRVYANDAPAATPQHLVMRFSAPSDGDIVLSAGNPGSTLRFATSAELAFLRDVELPWRLGMLNAARTRIGVFARSSPERARLAEPALQSLNNAAKAFDGWLQALRDNAQFARIVAREDDLKARVHRNLAAQRDVADAWTQAARVEAGAAGAFYSYQYLELRAGERSQLFAWARDIVRGAAERAKPDAARLPRYRSDRLWAVTQSLRADAQIDPDWEALNLQLWLESLRAQMPARSAAVQHVFAGQEPAGLAQALSRSRLADASVRLALWEGGADAVAASDDPMIQFVRRWDEDARLARSRYDATVAAPLARARERIAQARFRAFGTALYPDATFSPRLSYGRIEGWREGAEAVAPFTRIGELYARAGAAPRALTAPWASARTHIDAQALLNIASSTDSIGGSSGSALLDRDGQVIGVVFDGNTHSLGGEFYYDGALNRTISVSSQAIAQALQHVYAMGGLLAELQGATPTPTSSASTCDRRRRRSDCRQ